MDIDRSVFTRVLAGLDVLAALLAMVGLLPVAGGVPSTASEGELAMDGLWFVINLGGALLLLAGGMKLLLPDTHVRLFVVLYVVFVIILGLLRLIPNSFGYLAGGWVLMACSVGSLLLMLHRAWLWATAGATWCALLLGIWSIEGIISFISSETERLSFFLPLHVIGLVLVLAVLVVHIRYRKILDVR